MNSYFVLYDLVTGEIQQSLCAPPDCVLPLVSGQGSLEGYVPPGQEPAYWVSNGELLHRGLPPTAGYRWTGLAWEADGTLQALLAAREAQRTRYELLTASDWTQLPDVPEATRLLWVTYRQALRDITEQPGYPLLIEWPIAPS